MQNSIIAGISIRIFADAVIQRIFKGILFGWDLYPYSLRPAGLPAGT
jgi:hypothetical protein